MNQVEMICLNDIVPKTHSYRKFVDIRQFDYVAKQLKKLEKDNPYKGRGLLRLFKRLLLRFMENLSDRELERYVRENNAAKRFCEFNLTENTPDHTVFCKIRKKIYFLLL